MFSFIFVCSALIGPPPPPTKDLVILIDTKNPHKDIRSRSIMAAEEPFREENTAFYHWLHTNYRVSVREKGRNDLDAQEVPCFKIGDDGSWNYFPVIEQLGADKEFRPHHLAFVSSEDFIRTLESMVKWIAYSTELREWHKLEDQEMILLGDCPWKGKKGEQFRRRRARDKGILKYQRPKPPFIYPPQVQESLGEIWKRFNGYPFLGDIVRRPLDKKVQEYCTEYEWLLMSTAMLWYNLDYVTFDLWDWHNIGIGGQAEEREVDGKRVLVFKIHDWRPYDVLKIGNDSISPFMGAPIDMRSDTQMSP